MGDSSGSGGSGAGSVRGVVGVGSSAGGVAALTSLCRGLRPGGYWAYVVAQHMAATPESHLVELLSRETPLHVVVAQDGMELQPDLVFVGPPGCDVRVAGQYVQVISPGTAPGPNPSIDTLFESIAASWGGNSVGVILSGTGTDGSRGVEAIAAVGGLVIAETPHAAGFAAMPQAAIDSGAVASILDPQAIGADLSALAEAGRPGPVADESAAIDAILEALRVRTGIDFRGYKRPTIIRQVARRQALTGTGRVADYLKELSDNPAEITALAQSLLVTVTSFFRDRQSWNALGDLLAEVLGSDDPPSQLRIWVPGCATGEEAYTAAMVASRAMGDPGELSKSLKVFATDLNENSLETARRGWYSAEAAAKVPADLRARWMTEVEHGWEVLPELRESIVFARHNVAFDPPFPGIHLICLRNTMIYLQPHLRDRVLRLCHFSLVAGGLLMLGDSERLEPEDRFFATIDAEHHIARRRSVEVRDLLPTAQLSSAPTRVPPASVAATERSLNQDALIRVFAPPALVLDAHDRVIEVIGEVSKWCGVSDGLHSSHALSLVLPALRPVVNALLVQLRRGGHDAAAADSATDGEGVHLRALTVPGAQDGLVVVCFEPAPAPAQAESHGPAQPDAQVDLMPGDAIGRLSQSQMVSQLTSTQYALQTTIEDLTEANEEMRVLNEELQASSEELQASSEELQASNEELAASNEELSSLNSELQLRSELLVQANTDLKNLQASLTSGMVLVDTKLNVLRYTPMAVRVFTLIESDIGRRITDVPATVRIPRFQEMLFAAIAGSVTGIAEVHAVDSAFLVQCQPYIDAEGAVIGAVVVVTDISELAQARLDNARMLMDLELVTDAMTETVWLADQDGRLRVLSRRVGELFGLDRDAVMAEPRLMRSVVHPDDRQLLDAAEQTSRSAQDLTYRIVRRDGSVRWILERWAKVAPHIGDPELTVATAQDITESRALNARVADREAVLGSLFENRMFGLVTLDRDQRVVAANELFSGLLGYNPGTLVGTPLSLLLAGSPELDEAARAGPSQLSEPAGPRPRILKAADGSSRFVTMDVRPVPGDLPVASVVIVHDASTVRSVGEAMAVQIQFDPQTGAMSRTFFREQVAETLDRLGHDGAQVALLWVDLDGFKSINDQYGHAVGDMVLREAAQRLRRIAGVGDCVGRLGGDEFAILVSDFGSAGELDSILERMLTVLSEPIVVLDWFLYISVSIGVAISPEDGADVDTLIRNSDTAMYTAKRSGGNQHAFFRPAMNQAAAERAQLRQLLAVAIRRGAFHMLYQPIFSTTTGEVDSVEALVRWDAGRDVVPAVKFVPTAEQTGQIRAIGRLVLRMVDADLRSLAEAGFEHLPVAVNFSAAELEDPGLVRHLMGWAPAGGFARVRIEVTESARLAPNGRAAETLGLLRRLGALIVIDDFGTGYSSLQALGQLQPSVIKIDRTVLGTLSADRGEAPDGSVLTASVNLAHSLQAAVVVEGIESSDQLEQARAAGAEGVQGFLLSQPLELPALIAKLSGQEALETAPDEG